MGFLLTQWWVWRRWKRRLRSVYKRIDPPWLQYQRLQSGYWKTEYDNDLLISHSHFTFLRFLPRQATDHISNFDQCNHHRLFECRSNRWWWWWRRWTGRRQRTSQPCLLVPANYLSISLYTYTQYMCIDEGCWFGGNKRKSPTGRRATTLRNLTSSRRPHSQIQNLCVIILAFHLKTIVSFSGFVW